MHSGSFLYNFVLLPLVCFGGLSVCLAFVGLLPGVGAVLNILWVAITGDWLYRQRKGQTLTLSDEEINSGHT